MIVRNFNELKNPALDGATIECFLEGHYVQGVLKVGKRLDVYVCNDKIGNSNCYNRSISCYRHSEDYCYLLSKRTNMSILQLQILQYPNNYKGDTNMNKFWYVYNTTKKNYYTAPKFKHDTLESAITEAQRLAVACKGETFEVLECVGSVTVKPEAPFTPYH